MKHILTLLILFLTSDIFAQTYTVESVPDPKNIGRGYVSNPDRILSGSNVSNINTLLANLEDSTSVQVAVVVVNSIGDENPNDFGGRLFDYWGIGNKEIDNGLLILIVMDVHRIEFLTGYGLEAVLTDAMCKRIQMEYMIPLAKESKFDDCVFAGVYQVTSILTDPVYRDEVYAYSAENYEYLPWWRRDTGTTILIAFLGIYGLIAIAGFLYRNKKLKSAPAYVKNNYDNRYVTLKFILLNIAVPSIFLLWQYLTGSLRIFEFAIFAYVLIMCLLLEKRFRLNNYILKDSKEKEPQDIYSTFAKSHSNSWIAASIFFPFPFIFYSLINNYRMKKLRNSPPVAADGKTLLEKLNEIKDDDFLKAFQLTEENLKSVDYDVWKHPHSNEIKIYRFENFFSKYSGCPKCKAKAYLMTKNETVVAPTYESSGSGMKTYNCKICNYSKQERFTIAKRVRSSSSGGSGGSGGGGSSWGGGSSGGGGAGSSW